jgi:hypothetical protein
MAVRIFSSRLVTAVARSLVHVGCTPARPRRTGSVKRRRSRSRRDAVGALDRFRETSTLDRRVRGAVPPHPLPSGERLSWSSPAPPRPGGHRLPVGCFPLGLVVPGLDCVRGLGALRRRGGGNHLRTGTGGDHRAAGRRVRSRPDGGKRRAAPRPGTASPPGDTVTRKAVELPGCPQQDMPAHPSPAHRAHAM